MRNLLSLIIAAAVGSGVTMFGMGFIASQFGAQPAEASSDLLGDVPSVVHREDGQGRPILVIQENDCLNLYAYPIPNEGIAFRCADVGEEVPQPAMP